MHLSCLARLKLNLTLKKFFMRLILADECVVHFQRLDWDFLCVKLGDLSRIIEIPNILQR